MRSTSKLLGLFAALVLVPAGAAEAAPRVRAARAALEAPEGAPNGRAAGVLTVRAGIRGHESLKVTAHGLRRGRRYRLFCDDPATADPAAVVFASARAGRRGRLEFRLDTGRGDELPHGATLAALAGAQFEIRTDAGLLVLSNEVPDLRSLRSAAAAEGCLVVETTVLADDFDAAAADAAPPGWDVTGTEVAGIEVKVDALVHDGAAGSSVRLADGVAADPGAPAMSRAFTAQTGTFAVEFALISSGASGRTVFQIGDDSGGPTVFATGLSTGLGLYEDGTIGFGIGDTIGPSAPGTTYHVRADFDLAAQTFDVTLDGTVVVTGRALGAAGGSLDRIWFGGSPGTTGTAWVDTVAVLHQEPDCPPVANAGPDQAVECAGDATAVTLDGTASADPEGAALTYSWSGAFVEGTASGPAPVVHFAGHGSFVVTLVVNDGTTDSAPDTAVVDLHDTTAPVITVTGLPGGIWPPNHKLVRLTPTVTVTDACDGVITGVTFTIVSNEADDGSGDGSTTGDVVIHSPSDFELRAERSGHGSGRIYLLTWTAVDDAGNRAVLEIRLGVPHDQGHDGDDDDGDDDDDDQAGAGPGHHGHGHAYGRGHAKRRGHGR